MRLKLQLANQHLYILKRDHTLSDKPETLSSRPFAAKDQPTQKIELCAMGYQPGEHLEPISERQSFNLQQLKKNRL